MIYFQSLTKEELAEHLLPLSRVKRPRLPTGASAQDFDEASFKLEVEKKTRKQANYRAQQIFHWVYQRFVTDWDQMTDLSKDLRIWLKENVEIFRLNEHTSRQALDGTHKFLWNLSGQKNDRKCDHSGGVAGEAKRG